MNTPSNAAAAAATHMQLPMTIISTAALFPLGAVVATPNALALLKATQSSTALLLNRHMHGDFGDLPADDLQQNFDAIKNNDARILSVYRLVSPTVLKATPTHERNKLDTVWIITEWDRSVTTVLCPHDY
ncbi:MAG: type I restriction endonuclease subunit M [Casimicrobium sp.]